MALHVVHLARGPVRFLVGRAHRAQLAYGIGRKQAPAHVVGQAGAADDAADAVAVAHGVVVALEHEQARALADDKAVARSVERRRDAPSGESAQLREAHLRVQALRTREAARDHGVGAAGAQLLDREFDRVQRRGTGGVQRVRRASQPQGAGDQSRRQARDMTVERMKSRRRVRRGNLTKSVPFKRRHENFSAERGRRVARKHDVPHDDADPRPVQLLLLRPVPSLPRRVQPQVEQRIELLEQRFGNLEAGEIRNKTVDQAGIEGVNLVRHGAARVESVLGRENPAARGNGLGGAPARREVFPEPFERRRLGEHAPEPDDSDAFRSAAHFS